MQIRDIALDLPNQALALYNRGQKYRTIKILARSLATLYRIQQEPRQYLPWIPKVYLKLVSVFTYEIVPYLLLYYYYYFYYLQTTSIVSSSYCLLPIVPSSYYLLPTVPSSYYLSLVVSPSYPPLSIVPLRYDYNLYYPQTPIVRSSTHSTVSLAT